MDKALDNKDTSDTIKTTPNVKVVGNPDTWELVCKVSGENWMKSTKRMKHVRKLFGFIPIGVSYVYQVSTEFRDEKDNVTACAEALTTCL